MQGKERIYLTGFMGSGKTTAGKKLAQLLGWSFADLDKIVEENSGMPIPEIFSMKGEKYFRDTETRALKDLDNQNNIVISTGGGAPCHSGNMDHMLANGLVIYLKLTPEQLSIRLEGSQSERPLIKDLDSCELLAFITRKLAEREDFYNKSQLVTDGWDLDVNVLYSEIKQVIS
ncbi:MAG: shikimate kinase [Methanosarcina sp.]